MKDSEVNKIIAGYMGWYQKNGTHIQMWFKEVNGSEISETSACIGSYTKSLDALVPVWEKLKVQYFSFDKWNNYLVDIHTDSNYDTTRVKGKTIQQAASHATAKAILELQG